MTNLQSLSPALRGADGVVQRAREVSPFTTAATPAAADYFDLDETLVGRESVEPGWVGRDSVEPSSPRPTARETDSAWREAEHFAAMCRRFEQLMADGSYSIRTAAAELRVSPGVFTGPDSIVARFRRGGVAALLPERRDPSAFSLQPSAFSVPPWFVPAARFFYLLSNRARLGGSVPEAVRRVVSLPHLPLGWTSAHQQRFLKAIGQIVPPDCPAELRERILAREKAGQPLVPQRLARQIAVNRSIVQFFRSPRAWELDTLTAPGSQRRWFNIATGQREIMQPGDWFGGDDATPGIAVCVPCSEVRTPSSLKFGVLLGRFQWLAYHDASTDKILAWDYVVRPRSSYRAEDILNGMGAVVCTHGIPRRGWQFEGGTWNSNLVCQAIELMDCKHWRTYSPHQKAIESVFNRAWTRLAVQFPHADLGRFRAEKEANCKLYFACKAGHQDPRRFFPSLEIVIKVFEEEVKSHNSKKMFSEQYGQWVPDDFFHEYTDQHKLREFSPELSWIFSPFAVERKIQHMIVRCRVPMFEDFSVPFEFHGPWMPPHHGRKVRIHFDPRQPRCTAKVVLLEPSGALKPGDVLGDAQLIGETTGHIRLMLGWADDDQRAGYIARQRTRNFLRRETRGIGVGGAVEYAASEERDGLAGVAKIEKGIANQPGGEIGTVRRGRRAAVAATLSGTAKRRSAESDFIERALA